MYIAVAIAAIGMIIQEVYEDSKQIREYGDDDHENDVWEAIIIMIGTSFLFCFLANNLAPLALLPAYATLRAALFNILLNHKMGWGLWHVSNRGTDRILFKLTERQRAIVYATILIVGLAASVVIAGLLQSVGPIFVNGSG